MSRITFDPQTALFGIAFISPAVTIGVGIAMNDMTAIIAMIWCIAMSVISATRKEP